MHIAVGALGALNFPPGHAAELGLRIAPSIGLPTRPLWVVISKDYRELNLKLTGPPKLGPGGILGGQANFLSIAIRLLKRYSVLSLDYNLLKRWRTRQDSNL